MATERIAIDMAGFGFDASRRRARRRGRGGGGLAGDRPRGPGAQRDVDRGPGGLPGARRCCRAGPDRAGGPATTVTGAMAEPTSTRDLPARRRRPSLRRAGHRQRLPGRDRAGGRATQRLGGPVPLRQPRRGAPGHAWPGTSRSSPTDGTSCSSEARSRAGEDVRAAAEAIVRPVTEFAQRGWRERAYLQIGSEMTGALDRATPAVRELLAQTEGHQAWDLLRGALSGGAGRSVAGAPGHLHRLHRPGGGGPGPEPRPRGRGRGAVRRPVRRQPGGHGDGGDDRTPRRSDDKLARWGVSTGSRPPRTSTPCTRTLKNWGRWGPNDERGALNHLTDARRVAAVGLVRTGESVSLAHDLATEPQPEHPHPVQHHMLASGDARDSNGIPGLRGGPGPPGPRRPRPVDHPRRRPLPHVRARRDVRRPAGQRRAQRRGGRQHRARPWPTG